jgi:very-short-patch-repair endonuclease
MSRKIEVSNLDNLVSRYKSGEPLKELVAEFGISHSTFYRILESHGLTTNSRLKPVPTDTIISRYLKGESELALSKEFGIARSGIRRRLLKAGIIPRTISQANVIRMSNLSAQERIDLTSAAHKAVRGRHATIAEREKRAKTIEIKGIGISTSENIMVEMLQSQGIKNITQQKAIGIYNVDIAIESPRIAIEINGGGWHIQSHHTLLHHKRVPYLTDRGWNVVIIWIDARRYPLTIEAANYVISLIKKLRLHKPKRGQYHVIRGNGESVSILSSQFNCLPVVK